MLRAEGYGVVGRPPLTKCNIATVRSPVRRRRRDDEEEDNKCNLRTFGSRISKPTVQRANALCASHPPLSMSIDFSLFTIWSTIFRHTHIYSYHSAQSAAGALQLDYEGLFLFHLHFLMMMGGGVGKSLLYPLCAVFPFLKLFHFFCEAN